MAAEQKELPISELELVWKEEKAELLKRIEALEAQIHFLYDPESCGIVGKPPNPLSDMHRRIESLEGRVIAVLQSVADKLEANDLDKRIKALEDYEGDLSKDILSRLDMLEAWAQLKPTAFTVNRQEMDPAELQRYLSAQGVPRPQEP